jgi:hypothetical protein
VNKRDLRDFLEPFMDEIQIKVRLPNGDLASIKEFQYEFPASADEAVAILSVRKPI